MDEEVLELIKIQQDLNREFKEDIKEFKDETAKRVVENEKIINEIKNNHLAHIENDLKWLNRFVLGITLLLIGLYVKGGV